MRSISATPSTVTTGDVFTIAAHVTSDVGVDMVELQAQSVTQQGNSPFCDGYATLTSGTAQDGVWTLQCTVPTVVVPGDYVVTPYVKDVVGTWVNTNGGPPDPTRGAFTVAS